MYNINNNGQTGSEVADGQMITHNKIPQRLTSRLSFCHSMDKTRGSVDIFVVQWMCLLEVFLWFSFAS